MFSRSYLFYFFLIFQFLLFSLYLLFAKESSKEISIHRKINIFYQKKISRPKFKQKEGVKKKEDNEEKLKQKDKKKAKQKDKIVQKKDTQTSQTPKETKEIDKIENPLEKIDNEEVDIKKITSDYLKLIQKLISDNLRYPSREKRLGIEAIVRIQLTLLSDGSLASLKAKYLKVFENFRKTNVQDNEKINENSGKNFQKESIDSIERIAPFPNFPKELQHKIKLDVEYNLKYRLE